MSPIIDFDATRDEDNTATGSTPDSQGDAQHEEEQLLNHSCVMSGHNKVSVVVHNVAGKPGVQTYFTHHM